MYKFIVYPFLLLILLYAYVDQLSHHMAYIHYYKMKYALNRAAHAAAMQINEAALANGLIVIDEQAAYDAAQRLLYLNSKDEVYKLVYFTVINDIDSDSTYHYVNRQWNIDVMLNKPAVVLVIEATLPHIINTKEPYKWKINGTSEVVTSF